MIAETAGQLRALAVAGDSYAAFKSAALACGLTAGEAETVWTAAREDAGEPVADVRESGMELRAGGQAWLTSTESVEVER